jgi:hypothetical protein
MSSLDFTGFSKACDIWSTWSSNLPFGNELHSSINEIPPTARSPGSSYPSHRNGGSRHWPTA